MIRFFIAAVSVACIAPAGVAGWMDSVVEAGVGRAAQLRALHEGMLPAAPRTQLAGAGHYVIQLVAFPTEATRLALVSAGARLDEYVPDNAYLAWLSADAVQAVSSVAGVRSVYPFGSELRISPGLAADLSAPLVINPILRGDRITVGIETFGGSDILANQIALAGGLVRANNGGAIVVEVPASMVPHIVTFEGVKWVDRVEMPTVDNNVARVIVGADAAGTRYSPTYLFGSGQVVGVIDTGLDTGNLATLHSDLIGRVIGAGAWGSSTWSDRDGHGTHVAGSAVGNGTRSGSNVGTHSYSGSFAGIAPEAQLSFQSVADDAGSLVGLYNFTYIMDAVYEDGGRVASNSWGANTRGLYDYWCKLADVYAYQHPEFLMLFAAGNAGIDLNGDGYIDLGSIASPATAKNVLAVGASENNETGRVVSQKMSIPWSYFGYASSPLASDGIANNPSGIAAFSSRGPTQDGRIKPELVAPGTSIISTRSSIPGTAYHKLVNAYYAIDSGTSMATPLTAGGAAIVRQYLQTRLGIATPSAALVKAVLMAGTRDVTPGQYGTSTKYEVPAAPNNVEGVGRLDVAASTGPAMNVVTPATSILSAKTQEYTIVVPGSKPEMRAVICWTDPTGASTSLVKLVNDLDLELIAPNGQKYTARSRRDNWETIYVKNPMAGTWKLRVIGTYVPQGPQEYALALFWRW